MTEKLTTQCSQAIKAELAEKLRRHMKRAKVSQSELARRMATSRAVVHRLLNPRDVSLTLATLGKALVALKLDASLVLRAS